MSTISPLHYPCHTERKNRVFRPKNKQRHSAEAECRLFCCPILLGRCQFCSFLKLLSYQHTPEGPFFLRIGSCRERHRRTRRGSRIVIPRSEATWESRSTRPHRGKAIGKIATACPRLPRAQSALAMTNLLALRHRIRAAKPTACKALNPRKGDAASVRRQSRQRLRSERRYRRNRLVRFYRQPVRIGSAFPRLPRAQSALAMTNWGAISILTMVCAGRQYCAGRGMPLPYNARLAALRNFPLSIFHSPHAVPLQRSIVPPPFPSASSHTCFASSTARGRRIIPARPNRR